MPRTFSYVILHYGRDYLGAAIESIYRRVEQIHVFYTPHPSHGHQTNIAPPESEADLMKVIGEVDTARKVRWYKIQNIWQEGPHRDLAVATCQKAGAELILVLDYDEVWPDETLKAALDYVWEQNSARNWLVNMAHLWRSFSYVCRDDAWPVRILDLRHSNGTAYVPRELGPVWHFGYAIRDEVLRYKLSIHGHKNEMRPDWYESKWLAWPPQPDCHPTNERGYWNPEPFDKNELPEFMRSHPYFPLERVD